jgi:zinc and cadmium transporter
MSPGVTIGIYSLLIVAASLLGGAVPSRVHLSHRAMQGIISFVGGLMLGIGLLHLVPHSLAETGSIDATFIAVLVGLLGMFFLIRTFHFHQHGPMAESDAGHEHHDCHDVSHSHYHQLSWAGVTFGLSVHTLLDGVALGAAVKSDAHYGESHLGMASFGVFLAIVLHKPLDALSITTLMQAAGWSSRVQQAVNAGFALTCPLGALAVFKGIDLIEFRTHFAIGVLLGISGGIFLCISLSDLLPEVQFHRHDRFMLSCALLIGVLIAYAISFVEPTGYHSHPNLPRLERRGEKLPDH